MRVQSGAPPPVRAAATARTEMLEDGGASRQENPHDRTKKYVWDVAGSMIQELCSFYETSRNLIVTPVLGCETMSTDACLYKIAKQHVSQ